MSRVEDWKAAHVDGRILERKEFLNAKNLPDGIREALIKLDDGSLRVIVDPSKGERIHMFTRRAASLGALTQGGPIGDTAVIEIRPDPDRPDLFVRLYVGKEVVLSTQDLYG